MAADYVGNSKIYSVGFERSENVAGRLSGGNERKLSLSDF